MFVIFTIRYTEKKRGRLTARNKYGIRVMDRVAKETGGQHIDAGTTDPKTYFRKSPKNFDLHTNWLTTPRTQSEMIHSKRSQSDRKRQG